MKVWLHVSGSASSSGFCPYLCTLELERREVLGVTAAACRSGKHLADRYTAPHSIAHNTPHYTVEFHQ
eukprot:5635061-Amphidinium_carterae.2